MIAYFLLIHRYPDQFKRLFRAIYAPGNVYLIHVDRRAGKAMSDDIAAFIAPYQGVEILPSRPALWGGYSLVDAELRGMARLLAMDHRWTHFINLSGQDFPLKSQDYIGRFFKSHPGTQFIRHLDQRVERPETMNRINSVFIEAFSRIMNTRLSRRFLKEATPYIGTQWKAVTRSFCAFICHDPRARRYKRFYRRSFIADEGFFQTVMLNEFGGQVRNDDLRMIDWVPDGAIKLRPRTFTLRDAASLMASPDLFARKFDSGEDSAILDVLERHIGHLRPSVPEPSVSLVPAPSESFAA